MKNENTPTEREISDKQTAQSASHDSTCSALTILQGCGLHGAYYDTIDKAAEGVRSIIRALRADLHDPPHDIQYAVLRKLGVEGFTKEGVAPTHQLIPLTHAPDSASSITETPAQIARAEWVKLFAMPMPENEIDYKRRLIMAYLMGQTSQDDSLPNVQGDSTAEAL